MKLANNIIRINGYKDGKRTHVDVEVPMQTVEFKNSLGQKIKVEAPQNLYDPAQKGFDLGLDAVTSMNMYNWCMKARYTEKLV